MTRWMLVPCLFAVVACNGGPGDTDTINSDAYVDGIDDPASMTDGEKTECESFDNLPESDLKILW